MMYVWWVLKRNDGAEHFEGTAYNARGRIAKRKLQGYSKLQLIGPYDTEKEANNTLIRVLLEQEKDNPIVVRK